LGGAIVVQKKFDPLSVIQAIEKYKPNYLLGVPTMFQRLLAEPVLKKVDHSSLKAVISGGALIDEATIRKCKEELAPDFISLYGSADGVNCHHKRGESIERLISTVGQPNANVCEIGILDDQGHLLEPGLEGEIAARGPLTPMQYVNAPDLDKKYRNAQGWVLTGDMGLIDERGYLVLRGRKKDTIIRGGMNISPSQIESVISEYSGVVSAACIPVPDPDLGQKVGLCLSMVNGVSRPDLASLNRFLLSKGVEKHKLPEYLRYYRALPLNPAGKVDKKQLQQTFACLADVPHTTMGQALAVISQQHIRSRFKMKFGKRA
jgi:acyl-CoA synthetase